MKKLLSLLLFSFVLILTACGGNDGKSEASETGDAKERKEAITNEETMKYLGRLLEPYLELYNLETEEQAYEVIKAIDDNSLEIKRELKRDYEKDIHAVDDLIALADKFMDLAKEVSDGNFVFVAAYGEEIGKHISTIATEYLDGDLPENYAEVIGVDNIYDLR